MNLRVLYRRHKSGTGETAICRPAQVKWGCALRDVKRRPLFKNSVVKDQVRQPEGLGRIPGVEVTLRLAGITCPLINSEQNGGCVRKIASRKRAPTCVSPFVYGHKRSFSTFFSVSLKVVFGIPISFHDLPPNTARANARSDALSLRNMLSMRFFSFFRTKFQSHASTIRSAARLSATVRAADSAVSAE